MQTDLLMWWSPPPDSPPAESTVRQSVVGVDVEKGGEGEEDCSCGSAANEMN